MSDLQKYIQAFEEEKKTLKIISKNDMKEEYDLSTMKSRPNPYAKELKK